MKKIFLSIILCILIQYCTGQSYNFEQGVKAYNEGELENAIDYFGRDIKDNPEAALSYYYRAIIYKYQEQNSNALSDINNAIKHIKSKEKTLLSGALRLRGDIYYKIENYEKMFDDYAKALKLTPNDPDILIERAQIYYDLKQYPKAEADYRQALKIDESLVMPYAGLGRNFIDQKKYTEAEKILNQLIKLSPKYSEGFKFRARAFFEQKKYDEAIEDIYNGFLLDDTDKILRRLFITYSEKNYPLAFSKVNAQISANPEKELWYYIRAQLFEGKYNFKAAISDYSKLIELTEIDNKADILIFRAKCLSSLGLYEESLSDYSEAISIDSTNAYYYGYRGDAKRLMGNFNGAIEDFTNAIALEPRTPWFYYRRGWIKEEFLKDIESGLNDYNDAISIDKNYAYTYLHRGRLYEQKLSNPIKAKEDFAAILSLDTVALDGGNCRHFALFHLGRTEDAIAWSNKIIEKFPTDGNYYDAACMYTLMNKQNEAINNLKLAFENGYRDFNHLSKDDDLDNIRNTTEFKSLVTHWRNIFDESTKKDLIITKDNTKSEIQTVNIPMKVNGGGTYEVPCKINDLKLNLIFDTGASDITISRTEAEFMLKNNYLGKNDIIGTSNYMVANGEIGVGTTVIFRAVDLGGLILKNVKATVIENKNAPLLFGQSALSKYGKITIDNEKKIISITTK
jgi:clan AA aspartic protease (TIGR02281 family)